MNIPAGERVRQWRIVRGLEQAELAARAEMDNARLCRIELGKTEAKAHEIERLAHELKLTMAEFYGRIPKSTAKAS